MLIRFIVWMLSRKNLSGEHRALLTNAVLDKLGSLPTHAIITEGEGKILIRGVPLEGERAYVMRNSADAALDNIALKTVHEQVLYLAISQGIHLAQTFDQVQFAKAAVWYGQQERKLLAQLATMEPANSSHNGDY